MTESSKNLLDSREDVEYAPVPTNETLENEVGASDEIADNDDETGPRDSITPLARSYAYPEKGKQHNKFKDRFSFSLSVFNLMNVILGSGILGLADAMKNLGILPFIILILGTAGLAAYTINILLHMCQFTGMKTYEDLAQLSFGVKGKVVTSIMIVFHCLGAICSYIFIIKNELPEVFKALVNYQQIPGEDLPIYLNGDFLVILVVLVVIVPLAMLKDIRFLGYSSAFGMLCMLFFTLTVVVKRATIPCPLPNLEEKFGGNKTFSSQFEVDINAKCEAKVFNINSRTPYAVPTMVFSFMCHASMLPIYAELRRPSIVRMQRVAYVSICNILTLYISAALFGYLTFYGNVQSELLLTYSLYDSNDVMIIIARMMVIICVTLSIPLLHYPARKTITISLFRDHHVFSWLRHVSIMVAVLTVAVVFVMFVPNIRDIIGMAGSTSSTSLLVVFPSAFFIRLTGVDAKTLEIKKKYSTRRKAAWVKAVFGSIFMVISIILIIVDWLG